MFVDCEQNAFENHLFSISRNSNNITLYTPMQPNSSKLLLGALAVAGAIGSVSAQTSDNDLQFVKADTAMQSAMKRVRAAEPSTVPVPKFAVQTRDGAFAMAVGGNISVIAGADLGNNLYSQPGAQLSFVTGEIPVPSLRDHRSDFYISGTNSFVDFSVVGFKGTENEVTGYIKFGTNGVSPSVSMTRAYMTYRGFLLGEALTLAQDPYASQPPTIDPQGPCGDLSTIGYQVSYISPSYSGFKYALGIEMPTYYNSNGMYRGKDYANMRGKYVDATVEDLVPDIPLWVEYQASPSNRVRATAIIRDFMYRDLVKDVRRSVVGWGTMLSGNFSFCEPLTFNFQAVYGKGIGNFLQDIAGRPLSYTPSNSDLGKMQANPMMGLVFGASYNVTPKLQFNAVGSYSRVWDVEDYAVINDNANYKYADYVAANCFYNITNYLQWGIEYLYGRHATWNKGAANDSRIQTQLSFTF